MLHRRSVLAVVVTYKAPERLQTCLDSIKDADTDVWVRDNSNDNVLYTKAVNEGLRRAQDAGYEYALVCCDDVTLHDGCISALVDCMEKNPKCGIASPLQIAESGEVTCGGCTRAFPYGRHVNEPLTHELYKQESYEQYWANGACFLIRTSCLREIGLLDEHMLFICSDSDISFRVRAAGWTCLMVTAARVTHEPNLALKEASVFIEKTKDEDSLYFLDKWLSGGLFQKLSQEGPDLTAQEISQQITVLRGRIAYGYNED